MLKIFGIFVIFVALCSFGVISLGLAACQNQPETTSESPKENQPEKENCATPYFVIKIGTREVGRFIHEWHDEIIAVGTVVIALFTIILGLFTVSLAKATDSLVEDARIASERGLRAYISITPSLALNWDTAQSNLVGVRVLLENHGQTVGTEISYALSMHITPSDSVNDVDFTKTDRFETHNSIFPRTVLPATWLFRRTLTPNEISDVEAGTHKFQVWGVLEYRDTFGKLRTTKFSFAFGGPDFAASQKSLGVNWSWEHCKQHNNPT
jgi:hypothetical protein